MELSKDPSNTAKDWAPIAIMPSARHNQLGKYILIITTSPVDRYEHQEEGMTLVIKAQETLFSTNANMNKSYFGVGRR